MDFLKNLAYNRNYENHYILYTALFKTHYIITQHLKSNDVITIYYTALNIQICNNYIITQHLIFNDIITVYYTALNIQWCNKNITSTYILHSTF